MPTFSLQARSDHPRVVRIVLLYAAAALTWVLVGDAVLANFTAGDRSLSFAHLLKGTVLVLLTAAALFWLIGGRESELMRERRRLELVLGQLPGLLWSTDQRLQVESMAGEIGGLRLRREAIVGRQVGEVVAAETGALLERHHRRALGGEPSDFRIHVGGHELAVRVEPLRDETGRIVGTVGFALEVTPSADGGALSVRDALQRTRVLGALGGLTLEVAHQLKNPLFALTAALDAFEQRTGDDPATARHRQIMRQQVARIERLVSGIQVYGRPLELDRRPTDLVELLGASINRARSWDSAGGVEMVLHAEGRQVRALVDREAIVGAFDRILRNAVEHAPRGSQVTVAVQPPVDGGDEVEVSVLDSGPGFSTADVGKVFEPLFARRLGGAGLGLAISERIVTAHGGRITATNRQTGGARVTVHLPAA